MARCPLAVIWLAVPEIVVQGFAAVVMVLVVAGVLAVLAMGKTSLRPRRGGGPSGRLGGPQKLHPMDSSPPESY
jgi:hypothetical protein